MKRVVGQWPSPQLRRLHPPRMRTEPIQFGIRRTDASPGRYLRSHQESHVQRTRHSISGKPQFLIDEFLKRNFGQLILWFRHYILSGWIAQVITHGKCLRDQRKMMSIATKVMIQIAAKLGGEPWRVALPTQVMIPLCWNFFTQKSIHLLDSFPLRYIYEFKWNWIRKCYQFQFSLVWYWLMVSVRHVSVMDGNWLWYVPRR